MKKRKIQAKYEINAKEKKIHAVFATFNKLLVSKSATCERKKEKKH